MRESIGHASTWMTGNYDSDTLYGDKVYFAPLDAVLVALDAQTGKVAWEAKIEDWKQPVCSSKACTKPRTPNSPPATPTSNTIRSIGARCLAVVRRSAARR
jgi:glucose dehydrogenase